MKGDISCNSNLIPKDKNYILISIRMLVATKELIARHPFQQCVLSGDKQKASLLEYWHK